MYNTACVKKLCNSTVLKRYYMYMYVHMYMYNVHVYTVEDKKTFPFGISRTMLLRGVSLTFYVNGRLKTVIERS